MSRYAVLLDQHDRGLRPIALVTEHDDEVRVHFATDCGLKREYRAPYEVLEPDGTSIRYEPGQEEYFNSVINTLSRGFVISELDRVEELDIATIVDLYFEKVLRPGSRRTASYVASTSPVWTYAPEPPPAEMTSHAGDAESMLARAA